MRGSTKLMLFLLALSSAITITASIVVGDATDSFALGALTFLVCAVLTVMLAVKLAKRGGRAFMSGLDQLAEEGRSSRAGRRWNGPDINGDGDI